MKRLIMEYVDQCPNGQIALLGYSQGAMVIGDVLCGFSEAGFEEEWSDPLAAKYGDRSEFVWGGKSHDLRMLEMLTVEQLSRRCRWVMLVMCLVNRTMRGLVRCLA